jgi:hypothetical protein
VVKSWSAPIAPGILNTGVHAMACKRRVGSEDRLCCTAATASLARTPGRRAAQTAQRRQTRRRRERDAFGPSLFALMAA